MNISRTIIGLGAMNGFFAVMLGAFGAHALKSRLESDMLAVYQTAVQYHFYHALALLLVGLSALHFPTAGFPKWTGMFFLLGIVLFSGSLYVLSITSQKWLGPITPLGGLSFIVGWLVFSIGICRTSFPN